MLNELIEVHAQLNLLLGCISEREVFEALNDDVALVWVDRLGFRCLNTSILVSNILWLNAGTVILRLVRLVILALIKQEGDISRVI